MQTDMQTDIQTDREEIPKYHPAKYLCKLHKHENKTRLKTIRKYIMMSDPVWKYYIIDYESA